MAVVQSTMKHNFQRHDLDFSCEIALSVSPCYQFVPSQRMDPSTFHLMTRNNLPGMQVSIFIGIGLVILLVIKSAYCILSAIKGLHKTCHIPGKNSFPFIIQHHIDNFVVMKV